MTVRLEDAAVAAERTGETHYAFPMVDSMGPDDLVIAVVHRDRELGWRLTMLEGRYDGSLRVNRTGHPPARTRRHLQNLVFHPTDAACPAAGTATAEAVRLLEGYEEGAVLHPQAARTVATARRDEDRRTPIQRPSSFSTLLHGAGIAGAMLIVANALAVAGLFLTWGSTPPVIRQYALSTTVVTLAVLAASPLLISRLARESRLFVSSSAQQRSRAATLRVGQLVIILAILSAVNGMAAIS